MRATALVSATRLLMRAAVGMLTALFAGFAGALGIVFEIAAAMLAALALAGMRTVIFVWHSFDLLDVPPLSGTGVKLTEISYVPSIERLIAGPALRLAPHAGGRTYGYRPVKREPGRGY